MGRFWVIVLPILLAVTAWGAMSLASKLNVGFTFTPEQLKQYNRLINCKSEFTTPSGSTTSYFAPAEDIEVDLEDDIAFLGVSDLQALLHKRAPAFLGSLIAWFQSSENKIEPMREMRGRKGVEIPKTSFNPIGLSILRYQGFSEKPGLWVFSINYDHNQPPGTPSQPGVVINSYEFQSSMVQQFTEQHHVKSPLFELLNDVAAISPTEFYVTNHHTGPLSTTPIAYLFDIAGLGTGNLLYCNAESQKCRVVLDGLNFANSVYLNQDHTILYLTETIEKRLRVYQRDILTNDLRLIETMQFDAFLDNMNMDMYGNLWIAGTMDALATLRAMFDTTKTFRSAPSIIYRLVPKTGKPDEKPSKWNYAAITSNIFWVEIVYADNGSSITPLSVAAPTRLGQVILGSPTSPDIIRCDVPDAH